MKVLLVSTFYTPYVYGGAEISIQKLAEELVRQGINVTILTTSNYDYTDEINGVNIIRVKINNIFNTIEVKEKKGILKILYKVIDLYNVFNYKKIKNIIIDINPDIIHTNNLYGLSPIIWRIAKKNNIKVVHTIRDYHLLCPIVHLSCRNSNCRYKKICKLYRKSRRLIIKDIDHVIYISRSVQQMFLEEGYFKNIKKSVIHNAIDIDFRRFQYIVEQKLLETKDKFDLVFIGTLDYHKGVDQLINTFKKLNIPNCILHIAGKGPLEGWIVEQANSNSHIKYHGFIHQDEIDEFLATKDILVAPSIWPEPFGRVIIDAYKNGLPVIASNHGGFTEIVQHERTGVLFEPQNNDSLAAAIIKLSSKANRNKYCSYIYEELIKYSIGKHANEYKKVYAD